MELESQYDIINIYISYIYITNYIFILYIVYYILYKIYYILIIHLCKTLAAHTHKFLFPKWGATTQSTAVLAGVKANCERSE